MVGGELHPPTLDPLLVALLGCGGVHGEHQATHPGRQLTGGLGGSPLQDQGDHLLGFFVTQGGHLGADHPGPGEVDHPGAEGIGQLGEPLSGPGPVPAATGPPGG